MKERVQILELLEAGKINTDEAVRLIKAMGNDEIVCCENEEPCAEDQNQKDEPPKGEKE